MRSTDPGADRSAGSVTLAYDLHQPAKPVADKQTSPLIVMHGLFGSKKNNRTISKVLARDLGRHVYALDLRNHGESPHDERHDYPAMAADVANFIRQHGLKEPTLIGHSMGAKTAMTLALQEPDLVANLIAVDNAPVDARISSDFARYIQGMKKIDEADVTRLAEADKILEPYEKPAPSLPLRRGGPTQDLTIRQFLLGNLHRPTPASKAQKFRVPLHILAKALDHMGDFPFKDPNEARFAKPSLFIRGTQSKYVPDELIPLIGQFFPLFELVDVEAGHWVISEKPEAFRQAVLRFLEPKE
ncbi:197ff6fc-5d0e-4840-8e87-4e825b11f733 [Thermothielavioides terrestris]|uniref:197ff6fc-5d0e-4840-8e87-4e825b11f733 n=1 Tax=Thermothielavioides terrestris TaxID=2587410 RepID=A0A446BGR9_9PEZI|nr:197ff6fc-5d0e-4840-8e87-4e825b11f733 [Thermothielavioides terrestris]